MLRTTDNGELNVADGRELNRFGDEDETKRKQRKSIEVQLEDFTDIQRIDL